MTNPYQEYNKHFSQGEYLTFDEIDFSIIINGMRKLPFYEDDTFLKMQATDIGIIDSVIAQYEHSLFDAYNRDEDTANLVLITSALSQMWIYSLYEVLRLWKERYFDFQCLKELDDDPQTQNVSKHQKDKLKERYGKILDDDPLNMTVRIRKEQRELYINNATYRDAIENTWNELRKVFEMVNIYRINLAKHEAPKKSRMIPRAPGRPRINMWCGAIDHELIETDGTYRIMNRRDIADALRLCLSKLNS
ncbi:MAG: hypothetical protein M0Q44_07280 [Methylobacter sp.]|jgi:hypothetical protein|nr:hypothetical protein [Methylobacter sp.]